VIDSIIDLRLDSRDGDQQGPRRIRRPGMSVVVLLVLAAVMLVLLRASILRRRRLARGLPVRGPWRLPRWLRRGRA